MQKRSFKNNWFKAFVIVLCIGLITACGSTGSAKTEVVSQNMTNSSDSGIVKSEENLKSTVHTTSEPTAKSDNAVVVAVKDASTDSKQDKSKDVSSKQDKVVKQELKKDVYHQVSFLAVGDVMVHKEQLRRAYDPKTDSFDFNESFVYVKPYIDSADYAFANLETTLAGRSKNKKGESKNSYFGYSGYPNFNAPETLADALKTSGFDFIGTANNHSLDKGLNGVINTLKYLRQINMPYTGTFDTVEERNSLKVVEVGGLKIGVIAYTYATNGISLKAEEMFRVNTLDYYKADKTEELYETVRKARKEPIDLLFVMMHYGNEYWEKPEKQYQAGITQKLVELGVDMVIGSHPHTLQPLVYTEDAQILLNKSVQSPAAIPQEYRAKAATSDKENVGKASDKKVDKSANQANGSTLINPAENAIDWNISGIYSLGNFISSQRVVSQYKTDTDTGAIMKWVYQWKNDEKPTLVKVGILPTIVVWQDDRATVLPIAEKAISAARADKTMKITPYVEGRIKNAQNTVQKRLTAFFPNSLIQSMQTEEDGFTYIYLRPEIKEGKK